MFLPLKAIKSCWGSGGIAPFVLNSTVGGNEWLALSADRFFPPRKAGGEAFCMNRMLSGSKSKGEEKTLVVPIGNRTTIRRLSSVQEGYSERSRTGRAISLQSRVTVT